MYNSSLLSLIRNVHVTYGSDFLLTSLDLYVCACCICFQRNGIRVRSVLSNGMNVYSVCVCLCVHSDLDVWPYILSAIFTVLSSTHIYTHLTGPSKLIDSILNHITSITNCFIVPPHLSTY